MNWRHWLRCPLAVFAAMKEPDPDDFVRVSGLVECKVCDHQLYDHPRHPTQPDLTVTCEGKVVKL